MQNMITLPARWLVSGQGMPEACVRHGEPAVLRRGFRGQVANWPFCRRCRSRRWAFMAAALVVAAAPFVLGFGLLLVLPPDDAVVDQVTQVMAAATLVSLLVGALVALQATPSVLAQAQISNDRQWVHFKRPHPGFVTALQQAMRAAPAWFPPADPGAPGTPPEPPGQEPSPAR